MPKNGIQLIMTDKSLVMLCLFVNKTDQEQSSDSNFYFKVSDKRSSANHTWFWVSMGIHQTYGRNGRS